MGPSHRKGEGLEEKAGLSSPISEREGSKLLLLGTRALQHMYLGRDHCEAISFLELVVLRLDGTCRA